MSRSMHLSIYSISFVMFILFFIFALSFLSYTLVFSAWEVSLPWFSVTCAALAKYYFQAGSCFFPSNFFHYFSHRCYLLNFHQSRSLSNELEQNDQFHLLSWPPSFNKLIMGILLYMHLLLGLSSVILTCDDKILRNPSSYNMVFRTFLSNLHQPWFPKFWIRLVD